MKSNKRQRGFILLEVMLAVAIFSIGVIALGRCVNNCMSLEIAAAEDQLARLALENQLLRVEAGETLTSDIKGEKLKDAFDGFVLYQKRTPLKFKNENKEDIENLYNLDITVEWVSRGEKQSKMISVYVTK